MPVGCWIGTFSPCRPRHSDIAVPGRRHQPRRTPVVWQDVRLPEAKSCLEEALAGYERIGAIRDCQRVERALRRFGRSVRRGRQGDRPVSGWASLTDAERRVAVTVAEGPTNLEAAALLHLSRHTVDFHLRQIFRKLNLDSRVELAWSVANGQALDTGSTRAPKESADENTIHPFETTRMRVSADGARGHARTCALVRGDEGGEL